MNPKIFRLLVFVGLTFLGAIPTHAADIVWTNISGGNWSTAANWSPNQLPGSIDNAWITNSGSYTVSITAIASGNSLTVGAVSGTQMFLLSSGSLTISNASFLGSNCIFTVSGGTLKGGTVTASGGAKLVAAGGILDGLTLNADLDLGGVTIVNGLTLNGTLVVGGSGNAYSALQFSGTQALGGTGTVVLANVYNVNMILATGGTTLTIGPGITVRGGSDGHPISSGFFPAYIGRNFNAGTPYDVTIINQGTILADVAGTGITVDCQSFTNYGTIQGINAGRIAVQSGSWGNAGTIIAAGSTLDLSGSWSNAGTIGATNATLNLGGHSTAFGQLIVTNSILNIVGSFTTAQIEGITYSPGSVHVGSGGFVDNAGHTLTLGTATGSWLLNGGTLKGGTVTASGGAKLVAVGGTLDGLTLNADLDLGGVTIVNGLTLNGTLVVGGSGNAYSALQFSGTQALGGTGTVVLANVYNVNMILATGGTTLTIGPGITVRGGSDGHPISSGFFPAYIGRNFNVGTPYDVTIINQGTILANVAGTGITVDCQSFTNSGTLAAANGGTLGVTVAIAAIAGDFGVRGSSTINFRGTARLDGSLTLASQPSGTFRLGGNLLGSAQSPVLFAPQGTTTFDGSGDGISPQLLEVMSPDAGASAAAFSGPFAFGTLALGNNTYVRLVDQSDNSPGTSAEALFVNSLVVPAGCTLDLSGLHLYTRASQINGTVIGGSVTQVPDSGPLALSLPTSAALALPGELDEWTFFGRAGQSFTLTVDTGSGSVLSPKLNFAEVRLLDDTGAVVARGSNTVAGQTVALTDALLSVDGTYRVDVRTPANQPSATGNYQITLWEVSPDIMSLVLSDTMYGRIETPYSVDRWTFSALAGEQVQLDFINASATGLAFDLRGPNGPLGFTNLVGDSGLVNLPADGNYTLTAHGTGGAYDIAYAFKLIETVQTELALGTNFVGQLVGSGQPKIFRISLTNSGPVRITLLNQGIGNRTELYVARGSPPTRGSFDFSSVSGSSASREVLIPSAPAGTLYVLVYGDYIPTPGEFMIQVTSAGLYLTGITPYRQANNVGFAMTLSGAGFESGATVELLANGGASAGTATNVSVDSFTQLTAGFPPNLAPPGIYSVRIHQVDGDAAILTNVFEVLEPGVPKLQTRLIVPGVLGRHALATLYIEFENAGTASMLAPVIQLRSSDPDGSDKPLLTLDKNRVTEGFWTSTLPQGFAHSITILGSGEQPGLLHPGEQMRVPVYFAGLLQPWDFGDAQIELGLAVIDTTDSRPMNWEGTTYGVVERVSYILNDFDHHIESRVFSRVDRNAQWHDGIAPTLTDLKQQWFDPPSYYSDQFIEKRWDEPGVLQLRPDSISEAAWSGIVTNLRASVGETLGDWVRVLGENAQYLARHGQPNANIDDLWRFEMMQASGLGPVPMLDAVTDASMVTPGVGLSLSRTFPNSIPARHVLGPFGFGWTFSWNLKLTVDTNGLVQIGSCCGGTQRRYEPDTRTPGKYFSLQGDTASLARIGNGTFELHDPNGTVTRFAANGLLDAIEDPNGNRVFASYDGFARLQTLTYTSGSRLTIGYNAAGRIASIYDSAGRTNAFSYDGADHLTAVTTHDGKITRYTYNTSGDARVTHELASIERGGTIQKFTYDGHGRLTSTFRAAGEQLIRFSYDSAGTVFVADSLGTNQLFYNELGLLTKVVDPLGHITSSEFDNDFRLRKLVLPTGENQSFAWTKAGNLTGLTDEQGNSTSFTYDENFNRMASFTDAKANTTRYTYDARGNLLTTIHPNNSVERFGNYTSAGLPLTYANRRGQPLTYEYNAAGQITNHVFADGHSIQFTYDPRGNLASTIDGVKVTAYTYDPANDGDRLKRVTYPNGRFLDYTYDTFGRRVQMTDQDGFATKYEYDSASRLWKLRDETNTLLVTYTYDPSGRLSRIDKGNGTFTTYEYDAAGQLLSLQNHRNAATLNSRFDYTYDRRGRRTSMSTLDGDWTYGYDAIGQLTRAAFDSTHPQIPDQDLTYEYDALGNRVRTIANGVTNAYVANNLNQYTSVAGTNHQYDADGNLTFDGVNTYEWDQQSRLVRVTGPSGVTEYEYDAFGIRMGIVENGQRTQSLVDPIGLGYVVAKHDASGNLLARNTVGIGLVSQIQGGGGVNYRDFDSLGSSVGVLNSLGSYVNRYAYGPFGNTIFQQTTTVDSVRFLGEFGVTHNQDGSVLMRARYARPDLGRFISVDPIRLMGGDQNLYRYVNNSPTMLIDPFGLVSVTTGGSYYNGFGGGGSVSVGTSGICVSGEVGAGFGGGGVSKSIGPDPTTGWNGINFNIGYGWGSAGFGWKPGDGWSFGGAGIGNGSGWGASVSTGFTICTPPPNPPPPGLPPGDPSSTGVANAQDPNEKSGPMGFGAANFLSPGASLPYRIKFENFGPGSVGANGALFPSQFWASAPAQEIEITDALSPSLDWSTLRFTGFGFGDTLRALERPRSFFQTILPVTINGRSFEVHFEASLNLATGRLRAVFRSIDPQTSMPPDVLTGFLAPEDGTGRGRGFIEYTVEPRAGLPTGNEIRNVALISFDRQPTIATDQIDPLNPAVGSDPAKQALVTIDAGAPTSSVTALSAESGRAFVVRWSGADDAGGSGTASYDVYVSTNASQFVPWFSNITATSALFIGELGKSYAFYSVAHDNVGNVEPPPIVSDAHTMVINNAPLIIGVTNQFADVGGTLTISNSVSGNAATNFVWAMSGPPGASINPSNGVLRWAPACSQGNTTNIITVWTTDRVRTNLSDLMVFTVAVKECVAPQLGRLVLRAGDTGRLPIDLISSVPLTNLMTFISVNTNRLAPIRIEPIAVEICGVSLAGFTGVPSHPGPLPQAGEGVFFAELGTCSNQSLIGTQQVAWLVVTALPSQSSAFVPVQIGPTIGMQPDGSFVTNYVTQAGRVVVVGEEPLLEALSSTNGLVQAFLYAAVGSTNTVQTNRVLQATSWARWLDIGMTNLLQSLPTLSATNRTLFLRAVRP